MKNTLLTFIIAALTLVSVAQKGSIYGATDEDSVKCVTNLSLYGEFAKQKGYQEARSSWRKACKVCPKSRKSLYINGVKMYRSFIQAEEDAVVKGLLIDTLMMIYDSRIEHFGQKGYVLGRKGTDMLNYREEDPEAAFNVLDEAFKISGNNMEANSLVYYYKAKYEMLRQKKTTKGEVIELFGPITEVIEYNLQHPEDDKSQIGYEKAMGNLEKMFVTVAQCSDLIEFYTPKFAEAPTDTVMLKTALKFLRRQNCEDEKLYMDLAIALDAIQPSADSKYAIGNKLAQGDCGQAVEYFKEAAAIATDDNLKQDAFMKAAMCSYNLKSFSNVRMYALKALQVNPNIGEAYLLIGDAYAATTGSCGEGECKNKAGYWAAVDKYQRAMQVDPTVADKASSKITAAKGQFPQTSDCFFHGLSVGDVYQVECWINESTTVRVRD